ncbi:iron-containing alcohol dehydrogenase [Parashewanella curva]|uniref:Iron-containing alcohol dehydrogenase n=1 Tax=Parashewanella curva TaxID=2338552 RepID=A0A3L8PVZ4_9GAMM|nr:iron-containing alcohol dehydrogenase [Parashewanella curva]RLV59550.1 iron-containing alcohol dehydrogenase [Parashewanella curva]
MNVIQKSYYQSLMLGIKVLMNILPIPKPLLLSGAGSTSTLLELVANSQGRRVFLVSDKTLSKLGIVRSVEKQLLDQGCDVIVYDEVEPDPSERLIDQMVILASQSKAEVVLALGGGSVIDAAKIVAILSGTTKRVSQITGVLKVWRQNLPLYVLPTTAGTGSEVTMTSVITMSNGLKKPAVSPVLVPMAAALDAELMLGLPAPITAATGMDSLTHAIEAYLSTHANKETDDYAISAIKLIFKNLPIAYQNGSDIQARQAMVNASTYAGLAFNKAIVGYVHAIAHQLGAIYHVPHGLANAIVLPYVLDFYSDTCVERLSELAIAIGITGDTQQALSQGFISAVRDLCKTLDIPTVVKELKEADLQRICELALKEAHNLYPVPKYMSKQECLTILGRLKENNL